jgi:DNA repair protein RecO (recombination protein O)
MSKIWMRSAQYWMLPEQAPFKVGSDARFSHVREAVKVTGATLLALKGEQDWSPEATKRLCASIAT